MPARKGFNNEHWGPTIWADISRVSRLAAITAVCGIGVVGQRFSRLFGIFAQQQFTGLCQVILACSVGEEAIVTDTVHARG